MNDLVIVMYIMFWHFIADFIMQSRKMAVNKSSSIKWLTKHVLMYGNSMLFGGFSYVVFTMLFATNMIHLIPAILGYVFVNTVLHWITDYFTSKQTTRLYLKEVEKETPNYHNFFVMIGFDQLIHILCLISTYMLLFK